MTYFVRKKGAHSHRWHVDLQSGDYICLCGVTKGANEKRKYHNKTEVFQGVKYDSGLEMRYAAELHQRKLAGEVVDWERQVPLRLFVNGHHICDYRIDFIVKLAAGHNEFTEVKGMALDLWKQKWRLLEATFEDHKRTPDDVMVVIKQAHFRR